MAKLRVKNCTGCGACANICHQQAIRMVEDERGFLKPQINKNKCTNCGLCEKICPALHYESVNASLPKVCAFINKNEKTRFKSASGGVFPAFANYALKNNGIVFGAIYDSDMKVCHTKGESREEISKMQSSKYVQSDTKYTYQEAKNALDNGKFVLYTGTPCQIAGLNSYLGKDYEKLLTIEVICHGVPSRKVFEMYKKEFMQQHNDDGKILDINMRDKEQGWDITQRAISVTTTTSEYSFNPADDSFRQAFLANLSINDPCVNCKFNKLPRVADVTMGDFWGVDDFDKSLNDGKGTSIVLINSPKGEKYFDKIVEHEQPLIKDVPIEVAVRQNANIIRSSKPHHKRKQFFKDVAKGSKTLEALNKKYLFASKYPKPVMIIYKILPPCIKNPLRKIVQKLLFRL